MIFYCIKMRHFFSLFLLLASTLALGIEVQLSQNMNIRYPEGTNMVRTGLLRQGSVVRIPKVFEVIGSNGRVDLQATLRRWEESQSHQGVGTYRYKDSRGREFQDKFYPIEIVSAAPGSSLPEGAQSLYMAMDFLNRRGNAMVMDISRDAPLTTPEPELARPIPPVPRPRPEMANALPPERQEPVAIEMESLPPPRPAQYIPTLPEPQTISEEALASSSPTMSASLPSQVPEVVWSDYNNPGLSCRAESPGGGAAPLTCEGVRASFQLPNNDSRYFYTLRNNRQREFIEFMAPVAQYVQAETGLPASVLIAMAIEETGWGGSYGFRHRKNIFAMTCARNAHGQVFQNNLNMGHSRVSYRAICGDGNRNDSARRFLHYDKLEDNVFHSIFNMLYSGQQAHRPSPYKPIRDAIHNARSNNPHGSARWQDVVWGLEPWAPRQNYPRKISGIIQRYNLERYDNNPCQQCLLLAGRQMGPSSVATRTPVISSSRNEEERGTQ